MAVVFLESFDVGLVALGLRWGGNVDGSIVAVRTGNGFRMVANTADDLGPKVLAVAEQSATFTIGFVLRISSLPGTIGNGELLQLQGDAATINHIHLGIDPSGALRVCRGTATGTLLGMSTFQLVPTVMYYVELRAVLSDAAGEIQLWIDNIQQLNLTGIDTKNGGIGAVFDAIFWSSDTGGHGNHDIDDLYLTNGATGRLGDVTIEALLPVGNGNLSQWTGSDGNSVDNYLLVDEPNSDGDTTYVVAAADGLIDLYQVADLAIPTGTIQAAMASAIVRHEGVGDNVRLKTRTGGANFNGTTQAASAGYSEIRETWALNPNTGLPWTIAEINAAEFGAENMA